MSPRVVVVSTADGTSRAQGRLLRCDASEIEIIATDDHLHHCAPVGAEVVVVTADEQFVGRVDAVESHWAQITLRSAWHDSLRLRSATRVPVDRPAEIAWRRAMLSRRITVRLADISATGCAITSLPPLRADTTVTLSTHLGLAPFQVRGVIVRIAADGSSAGIMFHELDSTARGVLAEYLATHIGRV